MRAFLEAGAVAVGVGSPLTGDAPHGGDLTALRERARRFREDAPELGGFEGLIWAVEELMAPLDAFVTAAERFREVGAR